MLRPDQYAPVTPVQKDLVWLALRMAFNELRKDGLDQIAVRVTYHADAKLPKFIFRPPDTIKIIRPGDITRENWDEYRAGLYDCMAAYWSWRLREESLRAAANSIIPNSVQVLRFHPIGTPGWQILRQKIRNRVGV